MVKKHFLVNVSPNKFAQVSGFVYIPANLL